MKKPFPASSSNVIIPTTLSVIAPTKFESGKHVSSQDNKSRRNRTRQVRLGKRHFVYRPPRLTLRKNDSNGAKNVTNKMQSPSLKLHREYLGLPSQYEQALNMLCKWSLIHRTICIMWHSPGLYTWTTIVHNLYKRFSQMSTTYNAWYVC